MFEARWWENEAQGWDDEACNALLLGEGRDGTTPIKPLIGPGQR